MDRIIGNSIKENLFSTVLTFVFNFFTTFYKNINIDLYFLKSDTKNIDRLSNHLNYCEIHYLEAYYRFDYIH